jgi:colicin import membrane protein
MAQAIKYARWQYPEPGTRKAFFLSLLAHSLLALMFTVGLNWKTSSTPAGVEVELWDNTPPPPIEQEAPAEKVTVITDEKAEIVTEKKKPAPKPEPKKEEPKKVEVKPPPPPKPKVEEKPKVTPKKEEPKPKVEEKPKPKEEVKDKPKAPQVDAKKQAADEKERADRLAKLRAAAGAESGGSGGTTGSGTGTGGVASPGYADKVRKAVKPYINFPGASQIEGNPAANVAVELAPDGRIMNKRITKSSGIADWDAAVLRALDAAGSLPKDENGKVPKSLILVFKPKD